MKYVEVQEVSTHVAHIILARSAKRNALSEAMLRELISAYEALSRSPELRVICLRGSGGHFSSGMDLNELGRIVAAWDSGRVPWADTGALVHLIQVIRRHPCVTLAGVEGFCGGGAIALVVAHDLAIATEGTRFILPETARGSFGALAAAAVHDALPSKVAFDMQLCGSQLTGARAAELGLVSRVVPDAELLESMKSMAAKVASRAMPALTHAKMAAYTAEGMSLERALMNDLMVGARQNRSADSFHDIEGFLKSRKSRASSRREVDEL